MSSNNMALYIIIHNDSNTSKIISIRYPYDMILLCNALCCLSLVCWIYGFVHDRNTTPDLGLLDAYVSELKSSRISRNRYINPSTIQ